MSCKDPQKVIFDTTEAGILHTVVFQHYDITKAFHKYEHDNAL